MENENRKLGTCKWFSFRRGYGFIKPDKGADLFVHYSDIIREDIKTQFLESGDRVSFIPENSDKGLNALCVRVEKEDANV